MRPSIMVLALDLLAWNHAHAQSDYSSTITQRHPLGYNFNDTTFKNILIETLLRHNPARFDFKNTTLQGFSAIINNSHIRGMLGFEGFSGTLI